MDNNIKFTTSGSLFMMTPYELILITESVLHCTSVDPIFCRGTSIKKKFLAIHLFYFDT